MHTDLSGKQAVVTGVSRGIGEAIARQLAEAGATVTGFSRSPAGFITGQVVVDGGQLLS